MSNPNISKSPMIASTVKITRLDKTLPLPRFETQGSFGFDFITRLDTTIKPGEVGLVPSNVIVTCPEDLALLILPRSSLYRKTGLMFPHSIGLIDRDYCGEEDEIFVQIYNPSQKAITVCRGDRIAQGLFVQTPRITFKESDQVGPKSSRGGFGSTGHRTK